MSQDERQWELDAMRGLMLVLMTLTHLPTTLSDPLGQPLGFVSAAEGFVLLSAYMAGRVYSTKADQHGTEAMKTPSSTARSSSMPASSHWCCLPSRPLRASAC